MEKRLYVLAAYRDPVAAGDLSLKAKGVLVRYFDKDRLKEYVRITVGAKEETDVLLAATKAILEERK